MRYPKLPRGAIVPSPRDLEIHRLRGEGWTRGELATQYGLSRRTINAICLNIEEALFDARQAR